ncbi:MAG: hypothetical protein HY034_05110 [Nitrospirae bacterium]|nr:hypothetical protein [Nitrospirota bacterium]
MNECARVKDIIYRYLKGELDKKKRAYVEGHVKKCIMCSAEMEFARKKISVTELLSSLQPGPSFFKRLKHLPDKFKMKIRRTFSRHPVAIPAILVLLFIFPLFGFYIKGYNPHPEQIKDKDAPVQMTAEALKDKPLPAANIPQKKPEKKEGKITVAALPKIGKNDEKIEVKKREDKKEAKQEEAVKSIPKTEEKAWVRMPEEKAEPASYRLTLRTELQPDIIFTKVESISEKLNALILFAKGFSEMDSGNKKEILVKIPKEGYKKFLSEMKGQFTNVVSQADKNIKVPNDISKDENHSFMLIEVN